MRRDLRGISCDGWLRRARWNRHCVRRHQQLYWHPARFELQLPSVAVGTASLTAGYSGDSIYDASVSTSTLREIAPVGQIGSISVSLAGNGSGSVTSVDGRITCGATCSGLYSNTAVVTLNAVPGGGRASSGWLGACTGVDPCVITVNGASSVPATFAPATPALNFDIDGNANARALTYLNNLRPMLDIGGDGQVDAMTDGVTLLRYLIGVRGNALMLNAVSAAPRRTSATSIEDYVQAYLP